MYKEVYWIRTKFFWFLLFTAFLCNLLPSSCTEAFLLLTTVILVLCPFLNLSWFLTDLVYSSVFFPKPFCIYSDPCDFFHLPNHKIYTTDYLNLF